MYTSLEENPFSEDYLHSFNSKDIVLELMCGICYDISVQAQECMQCGQIFCEKCIQDYKKKKNICPTCNKQGWDLKKPHKVYLNIFSRLQFKCQSPGCLKSYTVDNFKSHQHEYPNENQIMYEYILLSEQGIKIELDQTLQKYLDKKYKNNENKFINYVQNQRYEFDFSNKNSLQATKCLSNEKCTLIRRNHSQPQNLIKYQWVWFCNDQKKWIQYAQDYNRQLNQFYETFLQNPDATQQYKIQIAGGDYQIDFKQLLQIRMSTNFKRSIFRSPVFNKERFISS